LKNNKIHVVPEDAFKQNKMLENVLMGGNSIGTISPNTFDGLKELKTVDLSENECLNGVYFSKSLRAMKTDIARNCVAPKESFDQKRIVSKISEFLTFEIKIYEGIHKGMFIYDAIWRLFTI
jgi:hypothetical protein